MNLIIIAALIAVSSAAKLDKTYLPPASAKSAGGSPGSLQAPFPGNSLNNGLGGLPKGGYTNDFQGVVVDAAAAGTRASEPGDSSLGRPRISYGSTDSKVGDAAFQASDNQFFGNAQATATAGTQDFPDQFNQFNQGSHSEASQNVRPRAELDRNANTIRFESDVGAENYHFAYETDNGISAEETGVAVNGVQAQGGFSYTGDDGQVYTVTYTADEGGFQPRGAHLPTPPPIPEEILKSLEQNARDEAAGLVDDGSYDAQKYNNGGDYTENEASGKYHQSRFGQSETDASASGSFISQNNQHLTQPSGQASNQYASSESHTSAAPQGHQYSQASTQHFGSKQIMNAGSHSFGNQQQLSQSSDDLNQEFTPDASNRQNQFSAQSSGSQNHQDRDQLSGNQNQQFEAQASASSGNQYSGSNGPASFSNKNNQNRDQFSGNQNQQSAQASASSANQHSGSNGPASFNNQNNQNRAQFSGNQNQQFAAQASASFGNQQLESDSPASFSNQNNQNRAQFSGNQNQKFAAQASASFGNQQLESNSPASFSDQNNQNRAQFSGNQNHKFAAQASASFGNQQLESDSPASFSNQNNQNRAQFSGNQNQQFAAQASASSGKQHSGSNAPASFSNQNNKYRAQFSSNQNQQFGAQASADSGNQYSGTNSQASSSFGQANEYSPVAQPSYQASQQVSRPSSDAYSNTASQTQMNSFGNKNEYLPPVNRPSTSPHAAANEPFNSVSSEKPVPLSQQNVQDVSLPQGPSTDSFGQTTFTQSKPAPKYSAPNPTGSTTFQAQRQQFGSQSSAPSEYAPPRGQNQAPSQAPSVHQEYNSNIQAPGDFQSQPQPKPQKSHPVPFSQVSMQPQSPTQGSYQSSQYHSTQGFSNAHKAQTNFASQRPTAVPQQELTTPFETTPQLSDAAPSATVASFTSVNSQYANNRPKFNQNNQVRVPAPTSSAFASFNSQQPPINPPHLTPSQAPAFPSQAPHSQFNQMQFGRKPQYNQPSPNQISQFASSTAMTFPQQPQGADDSYYYNQPSQPFNTPQESMFSATQNNQFNKLNQKSYLLNNNFPQSGQFSGKYPRPPTIAPTLASQNTFNGVTQAAVSSFPSEAPTLPTPSVSPIQSFNKQYSTSQQSYYQPPAVIDQSPPTHQSQSEQHSSPSTSVAPSVTNPQENAEVYEYSKPEEPSPVQQQASASAQFGQKDTKVGRPTFDNQFSKKQSTPQYNQNIQQQSQSFGVQRPTQGPRNERPVFGQKTQPFQVAQPSQATKFITQAPTNSLASTFNAQADSESANSVAGKGEIFGGPRNPPSFDAETGYHY